jgi:hypothetical protein
MTIKLWVYDNQCLVLTSIVEIFEFSKNISFLVFLIFQILKTTKNLRTHFLSYSLLLTKINCCVSFYAGMFPKK